MAVQLPTPGEEPWGDELNTAILSLDDRLTTVESSGGGGGGGEGTVDDDLSGAWFTNRRWYPVGTSLTSQGFYTGRLATLSGMNMMANKGASGGSLCGVGGTANANVWAQLVSIPNDAEVITMETCNDVRLSATLGSFADSESNGHMISFYGALKEACAWVLTNRPAARFFLITNYADALTGSGWGNFKNPNLLGLYPFQYNNAVKEVADIYGVPLLKVAEESGINYYTNQWFTSDTIHLNDLGGQRFAEYCWSRMRRMSWLTSRPTAPGGIVNVAVTGVTIDQGTGVSVAMGGTTQLSHVVAPSNATDKRVTWTVDADWVATVSANGLVTGVSNGTANVTVHTTDGNKTDTILVTVASAAVSSVDLTPPTTTINLPGTQQLTATVLPANAANKGVTYSSNTPAVATVNSTGLITGVANGSATITVTTMEGGFTDTCVVTVATIAVTGITLAPTTATVAVAGTQQLTPTIQPSNATNKTVTYGSSDGAKATVNGSGLVTGVAVGSALITATASGSFQASSTITVSAGEQWTMAAQTTFRGLGLNGVSATGSNPTYTTTVGTFGSLLINTPGDNAIEFAVGNGVKGMWVSHGSNTGATDFVALGSTAIPFVNFTNNGIFVAGGYAAGIAMVPAAANAGFASNIVYRVGRIGTRVKIVRVDAGPTLVTIWDGDLATNFPSNAATYATINLGVVQIGVPNESYTLPINCKTGVWSL